MFKVSCLLLTVLVGGFCGSDAFSKSDCGLPVQNPGPNGESCLALIPVFTWSVSENKCVSDHYYGCFGTNNNFPRLEDCEKIAKPICQN
ncbi:hypothetical protein JTB14_021263 [Gonioctena quinquepunctata]|nr:hypothetical protein JTB14_021263 [Gonioctena quinquepunctata]